MVSAKGFVAVARRIAAAILMRRMPASSITADSGGAGKFTSNPAVQGGTVHAATTTVGAVTARAFLHFHMGVPVFPSLGNRSAPEPRPERRGRPKCKGSARPHFKLGGGETDVVWFEGSP